MINRMKKICSGRMALFLGALLGLLILSCGNQKYLVEPTCTLPSGVNIEEALAHSREDLGHLECEPMFDSYYLRLIDVAKRDPSIENKRRFSDFLEWANDEGIIDRIQARNYYNRYFNTTFITYYPLKTYSFIFSTRAFKVLCWSKNPFTKKTISLWLQRTVIDCLWLCDFSIRPTKNLLR